ncbi:MAG: hypothetical protein JJE49_05930, partial [Peptostreptococcaceae bacterium]|nr:hypothetical protein [Peptostreptococcaceae bacterium]
MKNVNRIIILVLVIALVIVSGAWLSTEIFKDKSEISTTGVMEKFNTISE